MPGAGAKKEGRGQRQTGEGTGMRVGRRELYGLFCSRVLIKHVSNKDLIGLPNKPDYCM